MEKTSTITKSERTKNASRRQRRRMKKKQTNFGFISAI